MKLGYLDYRLLSYIKTLKKKSKTARFNRIISRSDESLDEGYARNGHIRSYSDSDDEKHDALGYFSDEDHLPPPVISNEGYYWIGKDYSNIYRADFKDIHDFSTDQFDRSKEPRMPWRDEALVVFGMAARDLARHFIQRWNHCKVKDILSIKIFLY
jgi:hypothetical protein